MPSGAVTVAVTVQAPLAEIEPPERLMEPEPGAAVGVPPQVELKPLGLATTKPGGRVSVKATPVSVAKLFGFVMEKLTVVVPPGRNLLGTNVLLMDGGAITVSVAALLGLPVNASLLDTPDAVFVNTPAIMLVTLNVTVQLAPAGIVMLEKLRLEAPALKELGLVPVQVPPTAPPAALMPRRRSVNAAPVRLMPVLGLVNVRVTVEIPPAGMLAGLNALLMLGTVSNDSMN
jgi:hypothetical protein